MERRAAECWRGKLGAGREKTAGACNNPAMIRAYQGRLPVVPATCYVDLSAQLIGDVELGENASVWMNAVLIGMGATILNDARIGEGSIVAAGAVIAEHTVIPPNSLVAGVPGKVRRTLGDEDRKLILRYAQDYLDYVAIYLRETE